MPRQRSRAAAKAAGTRFNSVQANYLADNYDDRIERRTLTGAKDRGDIAGFRLPIELGGKRIVVECKDARPIQLGSWYSEAEVERVNDGAVLTMVMHKRYGISDPGQQWVTMTVDDMLALLTGARPIRAAA